MSSEDSFKMNDGDWICSDSQCSNVNFARRATCNRCGKEKTAIPQRKKLGHEIGKAAAEKSRGLFSADDWQCGRCGNVNWARRQQCNMCNAPKFGEVEERTGLGGGYNERENVEYIEREESDGEYDEYGRKKKKYRGDDKPEKVKSQPVKEEKVKDNHKFKIEEEEDEDDDDDEDGDLSKYDLTGWGDDDEDNDTPNKKDKKAASPARSRSSASSKSESSHSTSRSSSSSSSTSKSSHSSSDSTKPKSKNKRHYSRSRSNSPVSKKKSKKTSSAGSRSSSTSSKSRDRSVSHSPANRK